LERFSQWIIDKGVELEAEAKKLNGEIEGLKSEIEV